jgi:hypothetical protein
MVNISKVSSVVSLIDGDEDRCDVEVLSFASDLSWVESGASGAVTASFIWRNLAARAARAVADG